MAAFLPSPFLNSATPPSHFINLPSSFHSGAPSSRQHRGFFRFSQRTEKGFFRSRRAIATCAATAAAVTEVCRRQREGFQRRKEQFLRKPDKSPKGSLDERVVDLCEEVNRHEEFFTTSSCSGRVLFWSGSYHGLEDKGFSREKVSHDLIEDTTFFDPEVLPESTIWSLQSQAFVLDVCCRDLSTALNLVRIARHTFDYAAIYTFKEGDGQKFMVGIDGPQHTFLDFPITSPDGAYLFRDQEEWLRELVNQCLQTTWNRIEVFRKDFAKIREEGSNVSPNLESTLDHGIALAFQEHKQNCSDSTQMIDLDDRRGIEIQRVLNGYKDFCITSFNSARICFSDGPNYNGNDASCQFSYGLLQDDRCIEENAWLELQPHQFSVSCRDLNTVKKLMDACGTLFRKPGFHYEDGLWILEVRGGERLTFPLRLPSGFRPFKDREDWIKELVNRDLEKMWTKLDSFLEEVQRSFDEPQAST
eukprot:TRINITY_DN5117_c0_g3_i1.p1 TRINITY_DN5117_c0_g3~~TRINITY_DN5117_c0_g3_i1.p1  ORF type:complete len:481 (-),score=56.48 TRINITY_DN5117_c0_g3_i1:487-1908(-)